jgi:hypothetical protein
MLWVQCGIFGLIAILGIYIRSRASTSQHAANVLGLSGVTLLALYLFAVLVLHWERPHPNRESPRSRCWRLPSLSSAAGWL